MQSERFFVGRPFKFGVDQQKYKLFIRSDLVFIFNVKTSQRETAATSKRGQFAIIKARNENSKYIPNIWTLRYIYPWLTDILTL